MPIPSIRRRKETIVTIVFFAIVALFSIHYLLQLAFPKKTTAQVRLAVPGVNAPAASPSSPSKKAKRIVHPSLQQTAIDIEKRVLVGQQLVDAFLQKETPLWLRFAEGNMWIRKHAGMRLTPGDSDIFRLPNGHLVIYRPVSNAKECAQSVIRFRDFLMQAGCRFLFVMAPCKSGHQNGQMPVDFPDHANENADQFMAALRASDIPALDLRPLLEQLPGDYFSYFFKADHHWKPETGLWAAGAIVAELNRRYEFGADPHLLQPDRFHIEVKNKLFLGSYGRKVTLAYADPEDYSLIFPREETDFSVRVPSAGIRIRGSFLDSLVQINHPRLNARDYYKGDPIAYMYGNRPLIRIHNHLSHDGRRVLLLKDSFSNVVAPFLALTTEYLDIIDLRHFTGSLQEYIRKTRPDYVLIQYYAENISTSRQHRAQRVDLFGFD